jgi:hypothetical protein
VKKRQTIEWDDLDPELRKELEKDAGLGVGAIGRKIWAKPATEGLWRVITPGTTVKKLVWKTVNDAQRRDLIVWTVAQVERAEVDPQREAELSEAMSSNEFAKWSQQALDEENRRFALQHHVQRVVQAYEAVDLAELVRLLGGNRKLQQAAEQELKHKRGKGEYKRGTGRHMYTAEEHSAIARAKHIVRLIQTIWKREPAFKEHWKRPKNDKVTAIKIAAFICGIDPDVLERRK